MWQKYSQIQKQRGSKALKMSCVIFIRDSFWKKLKNTEKLDCMENDPSAGPLSIISYSEVSSIFFFGFFFKSSFLWTQFCTQSGMSQLNKAQVPSTHHISQNLQLTWIKTLQWEYVICWPSETVSGASLEWFLKSKILSGKCSHWEIAKVITGTIQ